MKSGVSSLAAVSLLLVSGLAAAQQRAVSTDQSGNFLIDARTAEQLWRENIPARVSKLYPSRKFRFVSEVTGGFTETRTCVVAARATLMPVVTLPVQGSKIVYAPIKSASAFDAAPSLSREQCQELARGKLKEAIQSVTSALAAS